MTSAQALTHIPLSQRINKQKQITRNVRTLFSVNYPTVMTQQRSNSGAGPYFLRAGQIDGVRKRARGK